MFLMAKKTLVVLPIFAENNEILNDLRQRFPNMPAKLQSFEIGLGVSQHEAGGMPCNARAFKMRTKGVQGVFENKGHSLSCLAIYWRCSDGILVASYLYIDACSSQKSPNAKLHQSAFVHISCIYSVVYIMFVQFGLSRTACLHCSHHRSNGLQRKQGTGDATTGAGGSPSSAHDWIACGNWT
jgi:hypothetical protein